MPEARTPEGPVIYAAALVLPVSAPVIHGGAVLIRDGRISAVGTLSDLRKDHPNSEVRDFPGHFIVPGAVNAHAHLGFRRGDRPEGGSFSAWLTELIARLPDKETWTAEAASNSATEAVEAGTTFMAESSPYGECLPQLAESGMAGAVYAEFFPGDFDGASPEEIVDSIVHTIEGLREGLPGRVDCGISVHSPYTVDPESSRLAARRARAMRWGLAVHVSESPEEVEFVRDGTGGLADIFGSNDWGGTGLSPVRYAESMELLSPNAIAAHLATGVSEEDIEVLARTGVAAAHCPRSNAFLDCGVSPVPRMMERGVRVGIGTDGLWSSPSMNVFEEARFAANLHGFDGATGLQLATLGGARALGVGAQTGSLEAGKWADFAVVEVASSGADPEREALEAAADGGVAATVAGGRLIYNRAAS